jgi:hypothetical protein
VLLEKVKLMMRVITQCSTTGISLETNHGRISSVSYIPSTKDDIPSYEK